MTMEYILGIALLFALWYVIITQLPLPPNVVVIKVVLIIVGAVIGMIMVAKKLGLF